MIINTLLSHLNQFIKLEDTEVLYLKSHIPIQTFPKNTYLLKEGSISKAFYFIIKGCVRLFYTVDGEEKTAFFYTENKFVSSYESFTKQLPSKHNLQCIEPTTVAVITVEAAQKLLEFSPKFEFLARIMMEEELIVYQNIISTFITLSNEQRYLHLLETEPELMQRIPQYYLATYLGVRPETLSRIRKRLVDK